MKFTIDTPKRANIWKKIYLFQFIWNGIHSSNFGGWYITLHSDEYRLVGGPNPSTKFPELFKGWNSYFYDACLKTLIPHIPPVRLLWFKTFFCLFVHHPTFPRMFFSIESLGLALSTGCKGSTCDKSSSSCAKRQCALWRLHIPMLEQRSNPPPQK